MNIKPFLAITRLNKPIGIFLLLWPTWWALWLAGEGKPNGLIVMIFTLGVILMRSAGCIINDIADRKVDGFVKRTCQRPLVTGDLSVKEALVFFVVLLLLSFALVLFLNSLTIGLACIGALLAIVYPFLKRVTHLPQLGLGLAFAWGVPMAFAALTYQIPAKGWWLFAAAALWPVIYDTLYAMADREDDLKIGVKSTAILFGPWDKWVVGVLQAVFLLVLCYVGHLFHLTMIYFICLLMVLLLFVFQQRLLQKNQPFKAFLNNNWVGFFIFLGIYFGC